MMNDKAGLTMKEYWAEFMKWFKRSQDALSQDFAEIDRNASSKPAAHFLKTAKIVQLSVIGFKNDNCPMRAAALTFTTILSIVPLLAFIFSIAKGFVFQDKLQSLIMGKVPSIFEDVVIKIFEYVGNTEAGALGTFGLLILTYTVVRTLNVVEKTFNSIWSVQQSRPLHRKFSDYISLVVVAPILAFTAVGLQSKITISERYGLGFLAVLWDRALPFILIWAFFWFLFRFVPNTHVKFSSASIAAVITGTIWMITHSLYIYIQASLIQNNKIYGGFAVVPAFLMYIYIAWVLILFGAELTFAAQNAGSFIPSWAQKKITYREEERAAFCVIETVCKAFDEGNGPLALEDICKVCKMPFRLGSSVLGYLVDANILVIGSGTSLTYMPSRPPGNITIKEVMDAVKDKGEKLNNHEIPGRKADEIENRLEKALDEEFGNETIGSLEKDLEKS
jgi:membrane protein